MDREAVRRFADEYSDSNEFNYVLEAEAITPECAGVRIYERPLIGCASADDPLWAEMKKPGVVGEFFMAPGEWLPGARSVISFFFPFTEQVRRSNAGGALPSPLWLHGRIEGQRFLVKFAEDLAEAIRAEGGRAVVPVTDGRFDFNNKERGMMFASNWSERHVAFISGLGTFGLSKGLITEKGVCGRFISLVTDLALEATPRPYTDIYEYCIKCGACARSCPVEAISLETGKAHPPCGRYQHEMGIKYAPRYGCGKCQVAVPCEHRNPKRKKT